MRPEIGKKEEVRISDLMTKHSITLLVTLNELWQMLKLNGDEGLLLLRFRPHTVLPFIINPDSYSCD